MSGEGGGGFAGAMPKEEIGASRFITADPTADGRGCVVAILDSGVDPGASGLSITTEGKPKIIDLIDCTGSGDVDTSSKVTADEDGCVTSPAGKKLLLNPSWSNPSGEWRVGVKPAFDLFTSGLVRRMKKERRKEWEAAQREVTTMALRAQREFEEKTPKPKTDEEKGMKKELNERATLLENLMEDFQDEGPLLHVVVWNDGTNWRAALDSSELYSATGKVVKEEGEEEEGPRGLIADCPALTDYSLERQHGTLSAIDVCNYALNIYDQGDVLSIVTDSSSHGTHVAGIVAAHHPEDPELNGVAPGAQIISCKIGDNRFDGMETGVGLTRALISVIRHKCDLINMSYGEPTKTPGLGRFASLAEEVVNKHKVIFVSSAGNDGPALTSVGAPGGSTSAIIGVGAYVSPALAQMGHSLREGLAGGLQYTWSSRGPTTDGENGVCLSAPGGAIAPVPNWSLEKRRLMNGTSMSSPNACGGIALMLSALKQNGVARISPHAARRALEATCLPLGGGRDGPSSAVLTSGRGMVQVPEAFELAMKNREVDAKDLRYDISVSNAGGAYLGRGVYVRDVKQLVPTEVRVSITPQLHEDAVLIDEAVPFEEKIHLKSSAEWVTAPEALLLTYASRTFSIAVDPSKLEEGVNYAEVAAYDSMAPWRGPLFRVPVTCIVPRVVTADVPGAAYSIHYPQKEFSPGDIERMFIATPEGATWFEVNVKGSQLDSPRIFMLHCQYAMFGEKHKETQAKKSFTLEPNATKTIVGRARPGATVEVCLAQFWSSLGSSVVDLDIRFHGLEPSTRMVELSGASGPRGFTVRAPLEQESLAPVAKLNRMVQILTPNDNVLQPMQAPRDCLPDGRQIHSLLLTYSFSLAKEAKVRILMPAFNRAVYDGVFEGQMCMIFDANKRKVAAGDIYPAFTKLAKGDYTARILLRHDDSQLLGTMKNLAVELEKEIDGISLTCHKTMISAIKGKPVMKELSIPAGCSRQLYISVPKAKDTPTDAGSFSVLRGQVNLGKASNGSNIPDTVALSYVVGPKSKDEEKSKDDDPKEEFVLDVKITEAVRDAEVSVLKEMKDTSDEEWTAMMAFADKLKAKYPEHIKLLSEVLRRYDERDASKRSTAEVCAAAEAVIQAIDLERLKSHLALKTTLEGEAAAKERKDMDEIHTALEDALVRKVKAKMDEFDAVDEEDKSAKKEEAEASFVEFQKWVSTKAKYSMIEVRRQRMRGHSATALTMLNKYIKAENEKPGKEAYELRIAILEELGWYHWANYARSQLYVRFPGSFCLF